jgi:hypothetical protein
MSSLSVSNAVHNPNSSIVLVHISTVQVVKPAAGPGPPGPDPEVTSTPPPPYGLSSFFHDISWPVNPTLREDESPTTTDNICNSFFKDSTLNPPAPSQVSPPGQHKFDKLKKFFDLGYRLQVCPDYLVFFYIPQRSLSICLWSPQGC